MREREEDKTLDENRVQLVICAVSTALLEGEFYSSYFLLLFDRVTL